MAGANNAQMKAQGFSQRQIEKKRASAKGPLTLDAMRRNPAAGWQAAARGEGGDARRAAVVQRDAFVKASQARAKRADLTRRGLRDVSAAVMAKRKAAADAKKGKAPKWNMERNVERSLNLHNALQDRANQLRAQRVAARNEGASPQKIASLTRKHAKMQARADRAHDAWFRRVSKATGG